MGSKLAINGGTLIVSSEFFISWSQITERDGKLVNEVLNSGILAGAYAPQVKALQEEFARYLGVKYCICIAVNSGTAALHMAVAAAGVGPGDEVITSAFSFLASATAAIHQGAIPVFVDINPRTFNLDPEKIKEKVLENTKAIIPIHIHGLPADMDEIEEDAAQAPGATYKGEKVGTLGDMAAFSLNQTENFQAGEGGFFVTNNKEYWLRADMVRMFGEQVRGKERRSYVVHILEWNYRMPELTAAVARAQLERLKEINQRAQQNAMILTKALNEMRGFEPPFCPPDRTHVYHKLREPSEVVRDKTVIALQAEGVPVVLWQTFPLSANPLFQKKEGFGKEFSWSFLGARQIEYHPEDYFETVNLLNSSFVIGSERFPLYSQRPEVIELWVKAIRKVYTHIKEVIAKVKVPDKNRFPWGKHIFPVWEVIKYVRTIEAFKREKGNSHQTERRC